MMILKDDQINDTHNYVNKTKYDTLTLYYDAQYGLQQILKFKYNLISYFKVGLLLVYF